MDEIRPDIVLADVNMPGMNGYKLCELIRANEGTRYVPVVLLVGSFEPFDQDEADRVGADRYLTKPFRSIAELVGTVNGLLATVAPVEETALVDVASQVDWAISEPASEPHDNNDIDSLYRQSFIETVEFSHSDSLGLEFSDDGIDDEMIQTSYAESDIDSLANASFFAPQVGDFMESPEVVNEEFGLAAEEYTHSEPAADDEVQHELDHPVVEEVDFDNGAEDDLPLDAPTADLPKEDPIPSAALNESSSFAQPESGAESLRPRFDDIDILELPEVPAGKAYEFTTPEQAAETGSKTQVVSLSPELMEIIVQKVVEKLAEKY